MAYDFDLFIIGAGSGGLATAKRAADYGVKVAIAEADRLGGTCVNRGCIPKKLMVYASQFASQAQAAAGYGWSFEPGSFSWPQMIQAINTEVTRLNGVYQQMIDRAEVTLYKGHARIVESHTVVVDGQTVTAERILIAVGSKPNRPDIPGIELAITSNEIFQLAQQPKRMVIFGGGYIGCEFACVFNALGTEVTQVIRRDQVLRGFDDDIRTEVQAAMERHGINIVTDELVSLEKTDAGLKVNLKNNPMVFADVVGLAALGRSPRLDNLGLENTRVELHRGAIVVDAHSQTTDAHIYAVGDCTNRINLTPVAIREGRIFADTHYGKMRRMMNYDHVPSAVFTTPEIATVGMTEAEAIEKYSEAAIRVYRSRFRPLYYTLPNLDETTLIKLIVHVQTEKVLGAHMVGHSAAEIIQGIAIAIKRGVTKADVDATIGIHPSSAEEFITMA